MTASNRGVVLVAGAGGFIGGHLVARLLAEGRTVRAVDIRAPADWAQHHAGADECVLDLRDPIACRSAVAGAAEVYNLAADMGGMGYIEANRALCMLNVLISTQLLVAARDAACQRYLFASSACVYAAARQTDAELPPLRESDAYPADPEDGYGWEKLFGERLCRHFREDFGVATRIARLHNVYGPFGTWQGGREKAPAALCRKVLEARRAGTHSIEIWGDGRQTRSFLYIDDAIDGLVALMESGLHEPVNIGSEERVTIDALARRLQVLANWPCDHVYRHDGARGVAGRCSDNSLARSRLGWSPRLTLDQGLAVLMRWMETQMA